ncbi:MAG: hypothetical protein C0518_05220 [Opitutus sp.]|nr:hypothetical protein [Opitutus sp.]
MNKPLPRTSAALAALFVMTHLASASPAPSVEIARRARAEREHAFLVPRPLVEAFHFFEPVGEKTWAEGWRPIFASEHDAMLHDGSVFTVTAPHPSSGAPIESVWTISRYDPPHLIEYRNVLPGLRATRITVRCSAAVPHGTRVTVRYTYHALSDGGDAFVAQMTDEKFRGMIESWREAIAAYLARGTPASP